MELLVIGVIVAVLLILAWLYFRGRETPAPITRTTKAAVDPPSPPPAAPPEPEPTPEGLPTPLNSLKESVRSGIQGFLFFENPTDNADRARPLRYEDVDPHVLDSVAEQIESIHNFRAVHQRLQGILNDPSLNVTSDLSSVIMADPVLSSKILKIVNSAYFGRSQKVNSIGHSLFLLGMVHLREILYREGLLELFKVNDPERDNLINIFWQHATLTSICASHLRGLYPGLDQGTLFTAGLIHDVGKIILVRMADQVDYTTQSTIQDEDRLFGVNHAVIGRLALEKWGFSDLMRSVVDNHHNPAYVPLQTLKLAQQAPQYLMVLFLANQLAKMILPEGNYLPVEHLHASCRAFIDEESFKRAALDGYLLTQIGKSETFIR